MTRYLWWQTNPPKLHNKNIINFKSNPKWHLIPKNVAIKLAAADHVVMNPSVPKSTVAQVLAAMMETRSTFNDLIPPIWFRLPNAKLTQDQKKYLKSIPPIPPMWRGRAEIFKPNQKVFWVAYDAAGARHHMYTKDWREQSEHAKTVRVLKVMSTPQFQTEVNRITKEDAKHAELKPYALATMILRQCPLRPGSPKSKHDGLTTLQRKHLRGNKLQFIGKSGQNNVCHINDKLTMHMLNQQKSGRLLNITDTKLRAYLHEKLGITTKDFRTMRANKTFFETIRMAPRNVRLSERIAILSSIAHKVAKELNNTPSIAKTSYISNVLQAAYLLSPDTVQTAPSLGALLGTLEKSSELAVLRGAQLQKALTKIGAQGVPFNNSNPRHVVIVR